MLTLVQRKRLLRIARDSVAFAFERRIIEWNEAELDEPLRRPSGAFVTLSTRQGYLRGCIGSIHPVAPLYRAVSQSALNAAFRDPRFDPVTPQEFADLAFEISVMGPIEEVREVGEIVVGRDGLIISRGPRAGLLLPQVATEYRWDVETFLSQTCGKAGLPEDAWRARDTRIERFPAEVFGDESIVE